jgi:hypothetical protein
LTRRRRNPWELDIFTQKSNERLDPQQAELSFHLA